MQAITEHGSQFSKWMELRLRTDRQLLILVNRALAAGMRSALEAAETGSPDLFAGALRAYTEASRLAPCLRVAAPSERRHVQREIARLRRLLDETEMSPAHAGAACH